MTINFRYARIGLIAGLACFGSVALAKQPVLPKDSALPAKSSPLGKKDDDDHGKPVSDAKDEKKGTQLANLAKSDRDHDRDDRDHDRDYADRDHDKGHDHDHDHDHDGHGHDHDHDHDHGHPRSPG